MIKEIARWIVLYSDKPIEEVMWLLEKIYTNTDKCKPNINDDYGSVLKFIKNGQQ
tara:strand:+ start:527 stop:691 length:165 start_codon:yes stop_codon:yes gene_type:complete